LGIEATTISPVAAARFRTIQVLAWDFRSRSVAA
jgi:hypothetical protein